MKITTEGAGETKKTLLGDMVIADTKLVMNRGGPFVRYLLQDLLQKLCDKMHDNVSHDYDNIIVIEGDEGSGKSNLAYDICKMYDPDFDLHKNLIYTIDDLESRLSKGDDKQQIFWLDEYYDIGNKRDWNSDTNKRFNKLLVKMRSRGWSMIMCIPLSTDSDSYVREHRSRFVLTCDSGDFENSPYLERGYFMLQMRQKTKLRHVGYGTYNPMPAEIAAEYNRYKDESQTRTLSGQDRETNGSKYRAKYETQSKRLSRAVWMLKNAGVPKEDIMVELGINSDNTYYDLVKRGKQNDNIQSSDNED